ncbi:unnamed protein product [Rotaria sp. Silwood2]|nr:unnamed protein product [Rotaria sp. Silwood2]CAF3341708.1 unnamed protein product [Rotaria sp. Silwood2]
MASNSSEQNEWYTTSCGHSIFILPVRYQDLIFIGQGTYGIVVRATDTTTGKYVAIKKLLHPFQTDTHAKRTYRELELLMYLNHPDAQVVQLYNVFTPEKNLNEFRTLYLVLNYVDSDLNRIILQRVSLTEDLIRLIIYSIIRGLKFIHSADILHRDLKPTNIGIDRNSNITILDFGLARAASTGTPTGYVSTRIGFIARWWRAPEIYLNEEKYDKKVDIWSVGCIMAELILLKPLFCGETTYNQLNKIFDIIGTPDFATLREICKPESSAYIGRLEFKPKKDFNELFGFKYDPLTEKPISGVSPEGIDFLDRLLSFDPRRRPTAEEALAIVWQMIQEFSPPSWINDDPTDD